MMSTKVRSFDNRYVRIPNEALIKAKLSNLTRFPIRRLELRLPVGYGHDFEPLRLHLLEIADRSTLALDEPAPLAFVSGFSDSGFQVELWVWCRTENLIQLRAELGRAIQQALIERGIPPPAVPGASARSKAAA
jgi:small-conductance mechanosensitive channel